MIVTIDGPAGAGKSSSARELASRLDFEFLDTGAMYRAVTLAALRSQVDPTREVELVALLGWLQLEMPPGKVLLNGEDVSGLIRTAEITARSAPIASSRAVRQRLVALQRAIVAERDMVSEGRDQGTIVFPNAACKFFLVADPAERARRRQREMAQRGELLTLEELLKAQEERDRRDAARDLAPMIPAQDAILLDTSNLTLAQVVDQMERTVRRCSSSG